MRKVSLFHLLAKSPLLGFNIFTSYWVAFVVLFPTKLISCHSAFICKRYGFPVFNKRFLPLIIWLYHILLDYDVFLHNLVVLVVTIPTSPRLSKTEFVCGRYCISGVERFLGRKRKERKNEKKGKGLPGLAGLVAGASRAAGRPSWPAHPGHGRPTRLAACGLPCFPCFSAFGLPRPCGRHGRPDGRPRAVLPQRAEFWASLLRGLLPHFFPNFLPPLELIFLHCCHPFELCYLSIPPIVLASF